MRTHVYAYSVLAAYVVLLIVLWQHTELRSTDVRCIAAWLGPLVWVQLRYIRLLFVPRDHREPKMTLITTLNESLVVTLALIAPPVAAMTVLLVVDVCKSLSPSRRRNRWPTTLGLAVHSCGWEGLGVLGARELGDLIMSGWRGRLALWLRLRREFS